MREVDFEGHPLAPVAGLVDHLAAGSADHRAPDAKAAGDVDVDEVALVCGGAGAADRQLRVAVDGVGHGRVQDHLRAQAAQRARSEEHTSELQSLMRISYAVFCLKKKNTHII